MRRKPVKKIERHCTAIHTRASSNASEGVTLRTKNVIPVFDFFGRRFDPDLPFVFEYANAPGILVEFNSGINKADQNRRYTSRRGFPLPESQLPIPGNPVHLEIIDAYNTVDIPRNDHRRIKRFNS